MHKQLVLVEAYVPGERPSDAHPEHPIYIPVEPPPETGLSPEHPIYIPVGPDQGLPGDQPGIDNSLPGAQPRPDQGLPAAPSHPIYVPEPTPPSSGGAPSHPIFIPVEPTHPIELPPQIGDGLTDEEKTALVEFLTGNLPPGPEAPTPV